MACVNSNKAESSVVQRVGRPRKQERMNLDQQEIMHSTHPVGWSVPVQYSTVPLILGQLVNNNELGFRLVNGLF